MEQRIGSSSQPLEGEPLKGAGFDPAFIPGLTSPVSTEPSDAEPSDAEQATDTEKAGAVSEEESAPDGAVTPDEETAVEETAEEAAPDGPVFEASDRRARIVADATGVRLSLDDQACEFRWDEIGAVETETARFGKRFTVTVHTPDRRWFPIEIEATARSRFPEWESQLDAVLDAYFDDEEGEGDEEAASAAGTADVETADVETADGETAAAESPAAETAATAGAEDEASASGDDDAKNDQSAASKS
ncbi:hypothetical protein ACFV0T_12065 [Streptomyces sp. NPDC059582]|uniref:hypothetical protein n=1 Tax=Streptomyces sp. NPDC059582 TaxID=3346875 RepID=UPI003693FFAE